MLRKPSFGQLLLLMAWPFEQWGINLFGPFLTAFDQLKYLVLGIEYFKNWIEVEPLATITT